MNLKKYMTIRMNSIMRITKRVYQAHNSIQSIKSMKKKKQPKNLVLIKINSQNLIKRARKETKNKMKKSS